MTRQTRISVVAALALAALTGCGGTSQADSSTVYEPLPPLSTTTPSASPAPQPTSRPAPESSEPSTTASAEADATDPHGETVVGGAPAGSSAAGGGTGQAAGSGTSGTGVPVAGAAPAPVPAPVPVPVPAPAPVPDEGGGGVPAQVTERTSSSTTTVTSTTLEARVQIVVTCEGLCVLDDLTGPGLTGRDGPISSDSLQRVLEEGLGGQDGDQQRLTDELVEQLTKGDWQLADTLVQGGDQKLVFSSAQK